MSASLQTLLLRALVAGALAGIVAAVFVGLVAEDSIDAAIAIEELAGHSHAAGTDPGHSHGEQALFSRSQQVLGGLAAAVIFGLVVGLIFGTVFAFVRHRLPGSDDPHRILLLAAIGFVTTALLPGLKYPANPPAVGDPATVDERTLYYVTFLGAAVLVAVLAFGVWQRLSSRRNAGIAVIGAVATAVSGAVGLLLVWPASPDRVPDSFPAQLLWDFRVQSLATLAIVWVTLGLVMGALCRTRTRTGIVAKTSLDGSTSPDLVR